MYPRPDANANVSSTVTTRATPARVSGGLIRVENISKSFVPSPDTKSVAAKLSNAPPPRKQVLRNISLNLGSGEGLAIIGENGAGKTTLLKIIAGIMPPDSGSVTVQGSVCPIIGLQAGFSPNLSGRENVYLKAATAGLSDADVKARMEEVIRFAGIGPAINYPLRTYSSGMQARLAFAVAFMSIPEVLIVDETLVVGDETFRRRSLSRIQEIREAGSTILFVTHGLAMTRQFCDRAVLLDEGELLIDSDPATALDAYQRLIYAAPADRASVRARLARGEPMAADAGAPSGRRTAASPARNDGAAKPVDISHPAGARIQGCRLLDAGGNDVRSFEPHARARIEVPIHFTEPARDAEVIATVVTAEGLELGEFPLTLPDAAQNYIAGGTRVESGRDIVLPLSPGTYFLNCRVYGSVGEDRYCLHAIRDVHVLTIGGHSDARGHGVAFT